MKKYNFLFLIFYSFFISAFSIAQNKCKVYGWVYDYGTQKPISNVNVIIKGTYIGTATDSSGYFKLELNSGKSYTIEFSCIGYTKTIRKVRLEKNEEVEYNIRLKSHPIELPPVLKEESYFYNLHSTFSFDNDELRKAGGNDLEKALTYLDPVILYPNWFKDRFSLKNNINNASSHNFTLYVNGKLKDGSDIVDISIDKIKYIKVWKSWRGVSQAPTELPLVEGKYVILIVTK